MPPRNRIEFSRALRREIVERATIPWTDGLPHCERCGMPCRSNRFEIDHIVAEAYRGDQRAPLTASDGQLLCLPHHKAKTALDKAGIERAKRISDKDRGVIRPQGKIQSRGFPKIEKPMPSDRFARVDKSMLPVWPANQLDIDKE